jgi:hypothetical protein
LEAIAKNSFGCVVGRGGGVNITALDEWDECERGDILLARMGEALRGDAYWPWIRLAVSVSRKFQLTVYESFLGVESVNGGTHLVGLGEWI